MELKNRDAAIAAAKRYAELCRSGDSGNAAIGSALISVGYCYFWFNELEMAIKYTEEALAMLEQIGLPHDVNACKSNLAYYLAACQRDKARALQLAEEAIRHMDDPLCVDTMGYVRMQFAGNDLAELESARKSFLNAAQADPSLEAAYRHLAEVDLKIKQAREKQKGP